MERHDRPVRSHRHIRIERTGHAQVESQVAVDAHGLALATIDARGVGCQAACAFTLVGAIESLRVSLGWPNVMMNAIRRVLPQPVRRKLVGIRAVVRSYIDFRSAKDVFDEVYACNYAIADYGDSALNLRSFAVQSACVKPVQRN